MFLNIKDKWAKYSLDYPKSWSKIIRVKINPLIIFKVTDHVKHPILHYKHGMVDIRQLCIPNTTGVTI